MVYHPVHCTHVPCTKRYTLDPGVSVLSLSLVVAMAASYPVLPAGGLASVPGCSRLRVPDRARVLDLTSEKKTLTAALTACIL